MHVTRAMEKLYLYRFLYFPLETGACTRIRSIQLAPRTVSAYSNRYRYSSCAYARARARAVS